MYNEGRKKKGGRIMGMVREICAAYPQTQLWMDSIIPGQIDANV